MRAVLILPVGLFYFSTNPKAGSRLDAVLPIFLSMQRLRPYRRKCPRTVRMLYRLNGLPAAKQQQEAQAFALS